MRRAALLAALAVGGLFASLAMPAAPLRRFILDLLTDRPVALLAPPERNPSAAEESGHLRVAVSAMISPERTYSSYGELFAELGRRVGHPVELVQRRTYSEVNELLAEKKVDLAWICTGAWPELARRNAARLLAVPAVGGRTTYRALVLVRPGTAAARLGDLAGMRFAYTDPISLTGCLYPKRLLAEIGQTPERFFSATFFTHGHDLSIEAVRRGLADAASVDSLVYEYLQKRAPQEVAGLRVIERSPPFPIPPLVVPAGMPATEAGALRGALASIGSDEKGRALLDALLIDGFQRPDDAAYASLE